jgi:tetratricopeptide (TPR) repeat protein
MLVSERLAEQQQADAGKQGPAAGSRQRTLVSAGILVTIVAGSAAAFVTVYKQQAARPARAAGVRAASAMEPRPAPPAKPLVLPALQEATQEAPTAAPLGWTDGSDVRAPSCDDLLLGELPNSRDATLAYDYVREGRRELVRGNWDAAERAFCRAILEPDASTSTRLELGQALLMRRDSSAAAQQAREVLALDTTSNRARELLGDALVRTDQSQEACSIWLATSKLPLATMSQRDFHEAEQATTQHDLARAERFYRRVVGCQPDHALAHAKLATTLAKIGQASSAQRWARRALQLAPDDLTVRAAVPANLR